MAAPRRVIAIVTSASSRRQRDGESVTALSGSCSSPSPAVQAVDAVDKDATAAVDADADDKGATAAVDVDADDNDDEGAVGYGSTIFG